MGFAVWAHHRKPWRGTSAHVRRSGSKKRPSMPCHVSCHLLSFFLQLWRLNLTQNGSLHLTVLGWSRESREINIKHCKVWGKTCHPSAQSIQEFGNIWNLETSQNPAGKVSGTILKPSGLLTPLINQHPAQHDLAKSLPFQDGPGTVATSM